MKNILAALGVISAISLIVFIPLFRVEMWDGYDLNFHLYRQASFLESLIQGNLVPRWGGNLNYGYGHPALMFHYPLNHYLMSALNLLGFDFLSGFKITMLIFYWLGGLGMFVFLNKQYSFWPALIAAVVFMLLPYRLVLIYQRAALAEHNALSWSPWIFYFFDQLIDKATKKWFVLSALAMAILITLHQAVTLMVGGLLITYLALKLTRPQVKASLPRVLAALFIGVGLAAFFWVPAIMEGKYTLRNVMMDTASYLDKYQPFMRLFSWGKGWVYSGTNVRIDLVNLALLPLVIWIVIKNKNLTRLSVIGMIGAGISLFFLSPVSKFAIPYLKPLTYFQFNWRFLSLLTFSTSLLVPQVVKLLPRRATIAGLMLFIAVYSPWYFTLGKFAYPGNPYFNRAAVESTTDTGEATPIWAKSFQGAFPKQALEIVSAGGEVEFSELNRKFNQHQFKVKADGVARLVDNTLYFPGWTVYVDGRKEPIEFQDQNWRGLITFPVEAGEHLVEVIFEDTLLRKIAIAISFISALILILWSTGRLRYLR